MVEGRPRLASRVLPYVGLYAGVVALFFVSMVAVYALPQGRIIENAARSAEAMRAEGVGVTLAFPDVGYGIDTYTDAIMIDTSIVEPPASPLRAAMAVTHNASPVGEKEKHPLDMLEATLVGSRIRPYSYSYYWHGYQVLLRPLLLLFDYRDLRYLNLLALSGFMAMALAGAARQVGSRASFSLAVAAAVAGCLVVPFSLQYLSTAYVAVIGVLAVQWADRRGRLTEWAPAIFLVAGMFTSFFDLLTAPVMTLGMILAMALVLRSLHDGVLLRQQVRLAIGSSMIWAGGYVGAWAAKWALGSLVLGENLFARAASQILYRSGASGDTPGMWRSIAVNVGQLLPDSFDAFRSGGFGSLDAVLLLGAIALLLLWLRLRRPWPEIRRAAQVLLAAPLPYMWYAAVQNHSYIHNYMTYRSQMATVFAVLLFFTSTFDLGRAMPERLRREKDRPAGPDALLGGGHLSD